jgi:putative salt-induced outer membrane protein
MQPHYSGFTSSTVFRAFTPGLLLAVSAGVFAADAPAGAADAAEEKPKWQTSAGLGFAYSSGNTENLLVTANIETQRKWERNEITLGVTGGYGETKVDVTDPVTGDTDEETQKNTDFIRGFGQYNRLFTERLYGYARADALHDDIAAVMYRVTLSPGVGYYFIKKERMTLSGEVGPSYVFERLHDEENGTYHNDDYATLRLSERFEYKISDRARFWQFAEYLPEFGDFDNYTLNVEAGVEADLTTKMALRVVAQDTYRSEPAPGRDQNDFKLLAGLTYKF